jgi:hypothetical protein
MLKAGTPDGPEMLFVRRTEAFAPAAVTGTAAVCAYPEGARTDNGAAVAPVASGVSGIVVCTLCGATVAVGTTTGTTAEVVLLPPPPPPQPVMTAAAAMTKTPIQ